MHEVGIMEEAVRIAVETAKQSGAQRISVLRLRIGSLSGVVAEALNLAFDVACQQPMMQGARLDIETVAATCWCESCQSEFKCGDYIGECPTCRQISHELRHGRELEIAAVEII